MAAKMEGNIQSPLTNNDEISDMNLDRLKGNHSEKDGRTIFDLLASNPMLGVRSDMGQSTANNEDQEETRRKQDKLKEQLMSASKTPPFSPFRKDIYNSNIMEPTKEKCEKLIPLQTRDKLSSSSGKNEIESSSVAASVQAALSALQAGQLSLNQVTF